MNLTSSPSVSIVIPSWNGRRLLEEMLPSLLMATSEFQNRTQGSWEVIVVDDGSVDDTVAWIESVPDKRVKLLTQRRRGGFSSACNLGFSYCRYETIILLNNDVIVTPDFILPLLDHFQDQRVFGVALKAVSRDQHTFSEGGRIGEFRLGFWRAFRNYDLSADHPPGDSRATLDSFAVWSACCAFDRHKLKELGGFEPLITPFYWEDVELCYRAWKRGWLIHYEPASVIYHDGNTPPAKILGRSATDRISLRNRLVFMWKNLHDPVLLSAHAISLSILTALALLTFRGNFFLGLGDALKCLPELLGKRRFERRNRRVKDRKIRKRFRELKKQPFVQLK